MFPLSRILSGIGYRLNKLYHTRLGQRRYNPNGVDVFAADWDTLIILDACRYDTFEKLNTLPGTLEKRISRGSTTNEFIEANVAGKDLTDTVYVTATPNLEKDKGSAVFHDIVNIWKDHWDSELYTVPPETVTEFALQAAREYPEKRLVVHYLQPHYPFIGPTGRQFDYEGYESATKDRGPKFWHRVGMGSLDVPDETFWRAYEENLEVTLPHVETLLETVDGKFVVTADHGEMINDRSSPIPTPLYGHPRGLYTPELVHVPWLTYTNGSRRRIVAEPPARDAEMVDRDLIDERLEDLGYRT